MSYDNSKFRLMGLVQSLNKAANQKEDIKAKVEEIRVLMEKQSDSTISASEKADILRRLNELKEQTG